jgi:hypothetical protein
MKGGKLKRGEDVQMLFDIKHLIEKSRTIIKPGEESNVSKIYSELDNLNKKIEDLKSIVIIGVKNRRESPKKNKVKKQIILILQKHKRLDSQQLGNLLRLSRVRANEYLRELETEKIAKGVVIKRRKYYMLEDDLVKSMNGKFQDNSEQI